MQLEEKLHVVESLLRLFVLYGRFYCGMTKSHLSNLLQSAEGKHLGSGGCILYLKGPDDRMMKGFNLCVFGLHQPRPQGTLLV